MINMIEPRPVRGLLTWRKIDLSEDGPGQASWESPEPVPLNPKPRLRVPGDERLLSVFASELAQHLRAAGIFVQNEKAVIENINRTALEPMTPARFVTWIERWVTCYRIKNGEEMSRTMSSADAAKVLVSEQFLSGLHQVERYNPIRLPAWAADGSLTLRQTGYDGLTRTLTARGSIQYNLDWSVARAREYLNGLLAEFPFAELERSKATVVAAMLTVYGLHLLPPTCAIPAFIYTANDAGCGKGLCCKLAAVPVFGSLPTNPPPFTEHEMEKLLFASARAGQQLLFLDNIDYHLASPSLESFLTTSHVGGRIMGESTFAAFAKKSVVLISGNNCTVRADMRRRSLFVEFFMEQLQAEHRQIKNPLSDAAIVEKRSDILSALYALVRGWCESAKPPPFRMLQGFTEWSGVIAAIVEHAGFGSPIPPPETNVGDDDLREVAGFVTALYENGVELPFRNVVEICQTRQLFADKIRSRGELSKQEKTSFSRLLKRYAGRNFPGGLKFLITGNGHARRYSARRIAPEVNFMPPTITESRVAPEHAVETRVVPGTETFTAVPA
jgi:hypothetical protein